MNYFLSSWIANFGVLPLLLFSAFLLDPAFFALSFLLILVIVVLDDISVSFRLTILQILKYLNLEFLAKLSLFVKGLFLFSLLGSSHLALSSENPEYLILSRGEQKEVSIQKYQKFSLGNPEVISAHSTNKGKMLVKAKRIGFSDIVFWTQSGIKKVDVFVIAKSDYLKRIQSTESFKELGLKLKFKGKAFEVEGTLESLEDWMRYNEIKKNSSIISQVKIEESLKNEIIASVYELLLKEGVSYVDCNVRKTDLNCEYAGTKLDSYIVQKITSLYPISLHFNQKQRHAQNYRLKFKIIQIEHYTKKSLNLGLNKVATTVRTLLEGNTSDIIGKNSSLFAGFNGEYELLSEPSQLITIGENNLLEIGSEIPYTLTSEAGNDTTQWKFAGIKVKTILNEKFQRFTLKYKTSLTRPSQDKSIAGSKESSLIYLDLENYTEVFELNFKTNSIEDEYMPLLGQIPILRYLFSSNGRGESYKQILGYVKLERIE